MNTHINTYNVVFVRKTSEKDIAIASTSHRCTLRKRVKNKTDSAPSVPCTCMYVELPVS
jgi:hypothetical protein